MMKRNAFPDFLVIGAGKSGTTSLNNYLAQHPGIFISERKEPNFFAYEKFDPSTIKHTRPGLYKYYLQSVYKLEDYLALFKNALPGQIKGETSNTYLYIEDAPHRVKHHIPNAKLIAIFRQPAERLYSRYLHLGRVNALPTPNFSDSLDRSSNWWVRGDLIHEGFYYKHLKTYFELFPKENIKVFLYEDFRDHPQKMMKEIFNFLGVDETFEPNLEIQYNKSGFIKNGFFDKTIGHNSLIQKGIKKVIPVKFYESLKKQVYLQKVLNDIRGKNLVRPKLNPEIKHRLTHEVYKDDILNLQELIGRDLSKWLA